ncbi:MAG: transposase family protein [Psychromonas sp.]|nr:transposase family protein [Psychromonas sp.]
MADRIRRFRHLKLNWLWRYHSFEHGIPTHDTIARVMCRIKTNEIESLIKVTGCDVMGIDKMDLEDEKSNGNGNGNAN